MFKLVAGSVKIEHYAKKAEEAIAVGDLMQADGAGGLEVCDDSSNAPVGVSLAEVEATDATTAKIPVVIPTSETIFEVPVGEGTLTLAMVGNSYDLADGGSIDVTSQDEGIVTVVGVKSASVALVKINS